MGKKNRRKNKNKGAATAPPPPPAPTYVKAIEDSPPEWLCTRCFEKGILLCTVCKARPYCSKECQVEDWKRHKKVCEAVPSKAEVKKWGDYFAKAPKHSTLPLDALSSVPRELRFPVGASVLAHATETEWIEGVVQRHWYREDSLPQGEYFPYQIRLINGTYIFAPFDEDTCIMRNTRENWIKAHHSMSMQEAQEEAGGDGRVHCDYCEKSKPWDPLFHPVLIIDPTGEYKWACRECREERKGVVVHDYDYDEDGNLSSEFLKRSGFSADTTACSCLHEESCNP